MQDIYTRAIVDCDRGAVRVALPKCRRPIPPKVCPRLLSDGASKPDQGSMTNSVLEDILLYILDVKSSTTRRHLQGCAPWSSSVCSKAHAVDGDEALVSSNACNAAVQNTISAFVRGI